MESSVLVSIDGPSKVGATFFGGHVETEIRYQQLPAQVKLDYITELRNEEPPSKDLETLRGTIFQHIGKISAGDFFRALTLAQIISEVNGQPVREIRPDNPEDRDTLLEFMAIEGIGKVLQKDPNIGARVSETAKLPGALDLCETAFCDAVSSSYHKSGGSNLVIADARNPLSIYARRGLIGSGQRQLVPQSIIPVYLDAPAEVAATWLGGDHATVTRQILERRQKDASRFPYPVVVPDNLTRDLSSWLDQFYPPGDELVEKTFHLQNSYDITEKNIQYLGGIVAGVAWDLHGMLNRQAT
jgi:hypothetical protein